MPICCLWSFCWIIQTIEQEGCIPLPLSSHQVHQTITTSQANCTLTTEMALTAGHRKERVDTMCWVMYSNLTKQLYRHKDKFIGCEAAASSALLSLFGFGAICMQVSGVKWWRHMCLSGFVFLVVWKSLMRSCQSRRSCTIPVSFKRCLIKKLINFI